MFYYLLSLYWAAQAFFVAPQPANLQPVEGFVRHAETAAALPGVVVRAMRLHVAVDSTRSDSAGRYRLALEPGRYDLEWSLAGYVTQRVSGVVVAAGEKPLALNAQLHPGALLEEVSTVDYDTYKVHAWREDPKPVTTPVRTPLPTPIIADSIFLGTTVLAGSVRDMDEFLFGATVKLMQGGSFVGGAITDDKGIYRLTLRPGTYDMEITYTGYSTVHIKAVKVLKGSKNIQHVTLKSEAMLSEVVVMDYKVPLIEKDEVGSGSALTSEEIKRMPTRDLRAKAAKTAGKPASGGDEVAIKGARSTGSDYYIDGVRVTSAPASAPVDYAAPATAKPEAPKPYVASAKSKAKSVPATKDPVKKAEPSPVVEAEELSVDALADESTAPGLIKAPAPRAGLLTAGEWNDLNNWNRHWADLLADGETNEFQNAYAFYPRHRYTVLLTNEQDVPVPDAPVTLLSDKGETLWEARTDNTGKAELWADLFNHAKDAPQNVRATVALDGGRSVQDLGALKPFGEGLNRRKIAAPCDPPKSVDIVWAVDATGSMGDEIEYLKTELLDVIGRAQSLNPDLSFRMGTVFYRDKGDEYLTRSSGLSYDIAKTVEFIRNQYADGGGDYPEAVENALEDAVFRQRWSERAIARICFLVLDASPHQGAAVNESLQRSIREAAKQGIRVIPVAASGIQKDTEFLMKFFGLATNGTYVFLTDHSGVGGKHLEATADEYKVEPLNTLLVRLLTEYTTTENCAGQSAIRFDDPQQPGRTWQALYYPNPAVGQCTVELPVSIQSLTLYDAEGKGVKKMENLAPGTHTLGLAELSPGVYTMRLHKDNQWQTGKLVIVSGE